MLHFDNNTREKKRDNINFEMDMLRERKTLCMSMQKEEEEETTINSMVSCRIQ